jgi:hypothetical protein
LGTPATDPPASEPRKFRLRSLDDLDRRTAAAKAAHAFKNEVIADLGGEASLTALKRALVHNTAVLGACLEDLAAAYLSGKPCDMNQYATLANAQARLIRQLGLERRAVDVNDSLDNYLANRPPAVAEDDPDDAEEADDTGDGP